MIITGKLTDYKSILKRQIAFEDKLDNKFRVEMNEFKFVVEKKLAKFDEMFAFWLVAKTEFLTNEIERMVKLSMVDFALTNKFKDDLLAHTTNIVTTKATAELTQIKSDLQNLYDQIGLTIISKTDFDAAIAVINSRIDELPAGGGGGDEITFVPNLMSVNDTSKDEYIAKIGGVAGFNKIYSAIRQNRKIVIRDERIDGNNMDLFPTSTYIDEYDNKKYITLFGQIYNQIHYAFGLSLNITTGEIDVMQYHLYNVLSGLASYNIEVGNIRSSVAIIRVEDYDQYLNVINAGGLSSNTIFIVPTGENKGIYFGEYKIA